jgi:hypothetical protein
MKYAFTLLSTFVLLSCNYERTSTLPAAPSPPAVTHTVSGTVRDVAGRPIEDASVSYAVTTRGGPLWKTDTAGRFQIRLASGAYTFIVSKPGFDTVRVAVRVDSDTTADFVLVPAARP